MKALRILFISISLAALLTACSDADGEFTGSEYMPDMVHSLAVESNAYNYYYYNTWDEQSTIKLGELVYPKYTVEGTVPRGYAGEYIDRKGPMPLEDAENMRGALAVNDQPNSISVPTNGHVPYYYDDTPEGRLAAIAEIQDNPFPITEEGLAKGKNLYNIFCAICHGEKGNGLGYIYDTDKNPQAAYPLAPANFLRDEFYEASNGRYYHPIQYGYNVMGAYADKMNYEERWQVIHWIRKLQADELGLVYSPEANTFNPVFGVPVMELDGAIAQERIEDTQLENEQLSEELGDGEVTTPTMRKK